MNTTFGLVPGVLAAAFVAILRKNTRAFSPIAPYVSMTNGLNGSWTLPRYFLIFSFSRCPRGAKCLLCVCAVRGRQGVCDAHVKQGDIVQEGHAGRPATMFWWYLGSSWTTAPARRQA